MQKIFFFFMKKVQNSEYLIQYNRFMLRKVFKINNPRPSAMGLSPKNTKEILAWIFHVLDLFQRDVQILSFFSVEQT